jgi:hypothetical protein
MKIEGEMIERYFLLLLIDTIKFTKLAQDREIDRFLERSYSRSGIISSAILLECLANILIETIDSGQLRADLDKLPFLSKIDVYLLSRGKPLLDRGANEVQGAVELKRIRDAFVHPKKRRQSLVQTESADHLSFNVIFPTHASTGISKSPSLWGRENSQRAAAMAISFVRHVLSDHLALSSDKAFSALASNFFIGDSQTYISETELCETIEDAKDIKIDLSFLIPHDLLTK